jgi:hypothetical protein
MGMLHRTQDKLKKIKSPIPEACPAELSQVRYICNFKVEDVEHSRIHDLSKKLKSHV